MLGQIQYTLAGLRYLLVEAILEDRLHTLPAHGIVFECTHAGRFQACLAELLSQAQYAKAAAECLLWMTALM